MTKKYENVSREMEFILAVKPFFEENNHKKIDSLLEMMNALESVKKASKSFGGNNRGERTKNNSVLALSRSVPPPATENDDSIHPDGVYDFDLKCMAEKNRNNDFYKFLPVMTALLFNYRQ